MTIDYQKISASDRYKLMAQSVVPRPIAWIVTEDEGVLNVAPFSYFTPLSSEPPSLVVSVGHRPDGTPKDTLANIRKHGRCTLCLVSPELLEPMHFSSKALAHDESEAEHFGIEMEKRFEGFPPAVKEAPVAFACTLLQEVDLPGSKTRPLILQIEAQYLAEGCVKDPERLYLDCSGLVARIGPNYALMGEKVAAPEIAE
ncbi:flavin reductase family protein [Nitratifractor salsuginis]|uniref:Flavin reductase domain protein FMN-binding protein n=1 Tax=Nitratifractor salsuginis (strain DSM 16511 / JCM 12458 / E9I37-1) TaxID=749222 RepID=E6WYI5_NITSE|nr:flavin reductase family protein [Nitratifractor salsuginis]ADV46497.1 flavin reductase domain protein FMN-binding protein [Nitratifractor salsuginis DSM 16511]